MNIAYINICKISFLLISILFFISCNSTPNDDNILYDPNYLSEDDLIRKSYTGNDTNNNNISDNVEKELLNNNPQTDTNEKNLWYLNKLNIGFINKKYMGYKNGIYLYVQVVDEGIEPTHEDLKDNLDLERSRDSVTRKSASFGINGPHGSNCAGVIGARGYNGKGVRGIAPFIKISSSNWIKNQRIDELEKVWFSGDGANDISISSNSWGVCQSYDTNANDIQMILEKGSTLLRYGLGRVYVFAAGNDRKGNSVSCGNMNMGSANLDEVKNNEYTITVGAITRNNKVTSYSNQGSNLLVSAYGGEIDKIDPNDFLTTTTKNNIYAKFRGTSAATPIVSGSIALILEACPWLNYKGVQYLIAKTSTQIDTTKDTWIKNSGGLYHSIDYGYGLINPKEAIRACENKEYILTNSYEASNSVNIGTNLNLQTNIVVSININDNFKARWVGANIDGDFSSFNKLEINLISPLGVKTKLIHNNNTLKSMKEDIRLGSFAFVDEPTKGVWKIEINNKDSIDILKKITLKIVGH
jgi:subtilisin family serine protease